MNTKSTSNLNMNVIEEAKSYAEKNKINLSKLVENYLNSLTKSSSKAEKKRPIYFYFCCIDKLKTLYNPASSGNDRRRKTKGGGIQTFKRFSTFKPISCLGSIIFPAMFESCGFSRFCRVRVGDS